MKKKALFKAGMAGLSRFLLKILPVGWRFSSKPMGLDLYNPLELWAGAYPTIFAILFLYLTVNE